MTAMLSQALALTGDELRALACRVDIPELPAVLAAPPSHVTIDRREAARERADRTLVSRRLILDGAVHPEVVSVLQALTRPDRELAMRWVTPQGTARFSAVRRGSLCAVARRLGDEVVVRVVGHGTELPKVASALLIELPQGRPADVQPVGGPLPEMVQCLSDTHDARALADQIRALGAESHAALLLGNALGSRQAFAEIVYSALAADADRISRGPAAVAVFYTKRGRLIAAPSASPTGQLWTTLKAGSDRAINQAISQLVELCPERWEE